MKLEEFTRQVPGFTSLIHVEKIKHFAWWLHTHGGKSHIKPKDIENCYSQLTLAAPANTSRMLQFLEERSPQQLLKSREGYRLERRVSDNITEKYGQREATVYVENLLLELPARVPKTAEREFLTETLTCLRNGAFRATIVMAWNLAYDHVCEWILADPQRLADFNLQSLKSFPKIGYPTVAKRDDFMEFKESHLLQTAKSARVLTDGIYKILKEKLDRRNVAAHPTEVKVLQPTAEEVIRDLIENVVLKLK